VCSQSHLISALAAVHFDPGTEASKMNKTCPDFIVSCFRDACSNEAFHGKWMTAETWAQVIIKHFKVNESLKFDGSQIVKALGLKRYASLNSEMLVADRRTIPFDHIGIFRDVFRQHGKHRVHCFYAGPKGKPPKETQGPWFNYICDGKEFLSTVITRSKTQELSKETVAIELKASDATKQIIPGKTKQLEECCNTPSTNLPPVLPSSLANHCPPPSFRYWDSTEAKNLFGTREDEVDALEAIDNQLLMLRSANDAPNGHVLLMEEQDDEVLEKMSDYQKWVVRQKILFLTCALSFAKDLMPSQTWGDCCSKAMETAINFGFSGIKNSRTVQRWYQEFRAKRKIKANNLPGKHNLPPFLQQNKDICIKIQQYARENLPQLSVELILEYIHGTIIPEMLKQRGCLSDEEDYGRKRRELLAEYGLTKVSITTVYRWMVCLGFKYEIRRKGYYVDGHEKPATIEYRRQFCRRYLTYERRAHRWIQITLEESKTLEENGLVTPNSGYRYTDDTGQFMVEYHVDSYQGFQDKMDKETEFGGKLSVRIKNERPLIMFGHDECIFKQYLLTKKAWTLPTGETQLVPKEEGQGVMISAFQSIEFGFDFVRCLYPQYDYLFLFDHSCGMISSNLMG